MRATKEISVDCVRKSPVPKIFVDHEKKITNFFGAGNIAMRSSDNRLSGVRVIFLCFTNRCGSNSLSEDIGRFEECGTADEHLNAEAVIDVSKRKGFKNFSDYLVWLFSSQEKKMPAVKASVDQILFLYEAGVFDNLIKRPVFIHAKRRDMLKQAVSFWVALETGKWTSQQDGNGKTPKFNEEKILQIMNDLGNSNARMESFFSLIGAQRLDIIYEDYISDREGGAKRIAEFLGVKKNDVKISSRRKLKKQSSSINDNLIERIRSNYV